MDLINRQAAIEAIHEDADWLAAQGSDWQVYRMERDKSILGSLPSAQPERLTDDDFETIRIHLNAYKETLCNQRRWKEAEEYQRIINRFLSFAQPERKKGKWIRLDKDNMFFVPHMLQCSECGNILDKHGVNSGRGDANYCPNCGSYNGGGDDEAD